MIDNCGLVSTDHLDADRYTSSQRLERALNQAIVQAEISESYEEYLEIFDAFYADDIVVAGDSLQDPIRGKSRVRALLANFLVPLHIMAEIGGLLISIRQTAIPGDIAVESNSAWTLELIGVSGNTCTLSWRVLRKWHGLLVIYEHHYDYEQSGGPLRSNDLYFDAVGPPAKKRPS
jgi:hypothetical protein